MTDLEKFIDLYNSVGIELRPIIAVSFTYKGYQYLEIEGSVINAEPGISSGYFADTRIYFDKEGKFIQQGIWE